MFIIRKGLSGYPSSPQQLHAAASSFNREFSTKGLAMVAPFGYPGSGVGYEGRCVGGEYTDVVLVTIINLITTQGQGKEDK